LPESLVEDSQVEGRGLKRGMPKRRTDKKQEPRNSSERRNNSSSLQIS
jgi:hypothetical protein